MRLLFLQVTEDNRLDQGSLAQENLFKLRGKLREEMFGELRPEVTGLHEDLESFFICEMLEHPFVVAVVVSLDEEGSAWL